MSVIMASHLGDYDGAAKDRIVKFHRAVRSCLGQTHEDFELIIVSDGCHQTVSEVAEHYVGETRINLVMCKKQELWSPGVRNLGINKATGDVIVYLDTDDMFGNGHLQHIAEHMGDHRAVFFDDMTWAVSSKEPKFMVRACNIAHPDMCGTSNIAHRDKVFWPRGGYKQDFHFINAVQARVGSIHQIPPAQYLVCHIPRRYDV